MRGRLFTGLVEEIGILEHLRRTGAAVSLRVGANLVISDLEVGDSISINGICLTVTGVTEGNFAVDAVEETVARTCLFDRKVGDRVNLERALSLSGRLGGHIVQGHVDGVGRVAEVLWEGKSLRIRIETDSALMRYIVEKGSIAVDGVSLTVVDAGKSGFSVAVIPYTLKNTTMKDLQPGTRVNLETDILAKYAEKLLEPSRGGLDMDRLKQLGF